MTSPYININNRQVPINLDNIDVSEDDDQDLHTLHIQDVQHLEYSQMAKHLTPAEISKVLLQKISDLPQEGQFQHIKASFQDIFKEIGKHKYHQHKYCQVQLIIDDNVKPIIQPQFKLPSANREKLDKILDELEESEVIKQVEGPND